MIKTLKKLKVEITLVIFILLIVGILVFSLSAPRDNEQRTETSSESISSSSIATSKIVEQEKVISIIDYMPIRTNSYTLNYVRLTNTILMYSETKETSELEALRDEFFAEYPNEDVSKYNWEYVGKDKIDTPVRPYTMEDTKLR